MAQAKPRAVPGIVKLIPVLQENFHRSGYRPGASRVASFSGLSIFQRFCIGPLGQRNGSVDPVPTRSCSVVFDEAQAFLSSILIDHSVILQAIEFRQSSDDMGVWNSPP